jgi:hypothetical protein
LFNPCQLPTHGCPCRRAHRSTVTNLGAAEDALISWRSLHVSIRMVCLASYVRTKGCSRRTPDFRASFSVTRITAKPMSDTLRKRRVCGSLYTFPAVARISNVAVSRIWAGLRL